MRERRIELTGPIDLVATCGPLTRGARDPVTSVVGDELRRATRTPDGPAAIRVVIEPRSSCGHATAWGPGADWVIERAPDLIGALDVEPLVTDHPVVRRALAARPGLRMGAARVAADVVLPTIVDQRVTSVEAGRTWRGLVRALGEAAPGPLGLRLPPDPAAVAALDDFARRRHGLELRRGLALVTAAREHHRLQRAADRGADVLRRELAAQPGIGPWTAAIAAELVCGDADAVAVGDWHLPRIVGWALAGEARADDARMLELLEPFRPHRARVVRALVLAGLGPPRTSARAEIPDQVRREVRGERDYRIRRTLRFDHR